MQRFLLTLAVVISLALLAGCGVPKQKISVSTDPLGATVYADGEKKGQTPLSVSLDKRSDHLLTIVKEGYVQEEIILKRRFAPNKALRDGVISGVIRGGDPKDVASQTAREVDEQERSGEAYVLEPSIVTIKLTPKGDSI